jgi:1-acyl-sn-glycerol-3-phosphate acyltransferase
MANRIKDIIYGTGLYLIKNITNYEFTILGEDIPNQALIASNHFGTLDPLLISQGLERKLISISGGSGGLFMPPYFIPGIGRIDLSKGLRKAIKTAQEYKEKGYSILIFPEGNVATKIHEESIAEIKRGVFYFSEKLDLSILPVSIRGIENIWPREPNHRFPSLNGKIIINVGAQINPSEIKEYSCERLRTELSNLYKQSEFA